MTVLQVRTSGRTSEKKNTVMTEAWSLDSPNSNKLKEYVLCKLFLLNSQRLWNREGRHHFIFAFIRNINVN